MNGLLRRSLRNLNNHNSLRTRGRCPKNTGNSSGFRAPQGYAARESVAGSHSRRSPFKEIAMNKQRPVELYEKVRNFDIDGGPSAFTFADRLAKENRWSKAFTERVIEEYRRFIVLAMTADHPVSPSEAVDEAWHLHLLYTESYWERLCKEVLGRPFHHGPTRGGTQEKAKFDDWYSQTLKSYRQAFGEQPPADIWPAPTERTMTKPDMEYVDHNEFWMVPRRWVRQGVVAACMIAIVSAIAGCGTLLVGNQGPDAAVVIAVIVVLGGGTLVWIIRKLMQCGPMSGGKAGCSGGSCGGAYIGTHGYGGDGGDGGAHGSHGHGSDGAHGHGHGCGDSSGNGGGGSDGGGSGCGGGGDGGGGGCGGGGCGGGGCGGS
jgi:hypothetical protein